MRTGIGWCQYGGSLFTLFAAAAAESIVIFLERRMTSDHGLCRVILNGSQILDSEVLNEHAQITDH